MALQTWAALNAQNKNYTAPVSQPQPGIVQNSVGKAINFFDNLSTHLASFGEGVLSPVTKGIASGVRAVQSTPQLAQGLSQAATSPKLGQALLHPNTPLLNTPAITQANQIMQQPLNMGLNSGPQQTMQGSTNAQNLGTAAQAASFLVPETELGTIGQGAVAGGLQTGGQSAEDPNATAGGVAGATVLGAGGGVALGVGGKTLESLVTPESATSALHLPGKNVYANVTPEQLDYLKNETQNIPFTQDDQPHLTPVEKLEGAGSTAKKVSLDELKSQSPNAKTALDNFDKQKNDTLNSRIKDATPSYNKNMVGTNIMDKEGNISPRIASEGKGMTGNRPVTTSIGEHAAGTELNNVPNYPDKGTDLEKSLATQKAISTEAEKMRSNLQAEDKTNPLDAKIEKTKVENLIKSNLPKEIQDKIGYIGKDSPLSKVGIKDNPQTPLNKALQEAMSSPEDNLPKTAAGRYYQKVLDAVKDYDGTREGKLDLRQSIDSTYKNARGKLAFGSDSQNALDETHSDIRDSINKDLKDSTQNTDTQKSLNKQSNLYNAKKVLDTKAQTEAPSKGGQFLQKHPVAKFVGRQLARRAVSIPLSVGATAAGVPLITAEAKKLLGGSAKKAKALK